MDENDVEAQAQSVIARSVVGRGLSRELGQSRAKVTLANRAAGKYRFELVSHRSLAATGFTVLMFAVVIINLVVGGVFYALGAWPVFAFCGLDVALIYWAFKVNYRNGKLSETIELTPASLTLTRHLPSGRRERLDFNPFWVRVRLYEQVDGRNDLWFTSHGEEFRFAKFLSDDELRDFAESLTDALFAARNPKLAPH
jgi:uncharacterized membrane protein